MNDQEAVAYVDILKDLNRLRAILEEDNANLREVVQTAPNVVSGQPLSLAAANEIKRLRALTAEQAAELERLRSFAARILGNDE